MKRCNRAILVIRDLSFTIRQQDYVYNYTHI